MRGPRDQRDVRADRKCRLTIDTRDFPGHPTSGIVLRGVGARYDDRTSGRNTFRRYEGEAAGFLPIGRRARRARAAWLAGALGTSKRPAPVPFYLQPSLGGLNTLRSFTDYRFHDDNMLVANAELRLALHDAPRPRASSPMPATSPRATRDLNLDKRSYGAGLPAAYAPRNLRDGRRRQRRRRLAFPVPPEGSAESGSPQQEDDARAVRAVARRMMMTRVARIAILALAATVGAAACAGVKVPKAQTTPAPPAASMWVEPSNLAERDLFHGPWGSEHAPDPKGVYTLVERKHAGVNLGLTVKDDKGREWSVKQPFPGGLDSEAPVEVVLSRLLVGGRLSPAAGLLPARVHAEGRLRQARRSGRPIPLEGSRRSRRPAFWKWEDNPFVGTKPYQGLIVMLMMFNSTDLKNTQQLAVRVPRRRSGQAVVRRARPRRRAGRPQSRLAAQESSGFVRTGAVSARRRTTVTWNSRIRAGTRTSSAIASRRKKSRGRATCLDGYREKQWADAFRAGGYEPAVANRFIAKLKEKIDQGRALGTRAADRE